MDNKNKIKFKDAFEHVFAKCEYKNTFNYELIYGQIIRYGYLLTENYPREYFEKFEEDFWNNEKNWLYSTNFKPYKF
jgi:hypothetical protein